MATWRVWRSVEKAREQAEVTCAWVSAAVRQRTTSGKLTKNSTCAWLQLGAQAGELLSGGRRSLPAGRGAGTPPEHEPEDGAAHQRADEGEPGELDAEAGAHT